VPQIKIGRRGCTESLITSIHNHWRSFECVKLRIHDDKVGGGGGWGGRWCVADAACIDTGVCTVCIPFIVGDAGHVVPFGSRGPCGHVGHVKLC
jgi:hypothetical protein